MAPARCGRHDLESEHDKRACAGWKPVGPRKGMGCKSSSLRMSDVELRSLHRSYMQGAVDLDTMVNAIHRVGLVPIYNYTACKKCDESNRCTRSHGRATLCDSCGGDGWIDQRVEGWADPARSR